MIITTTFTVEGYKIESYKGIVRGIIVRSPTIMQGIFGNLKTMIGGNIGSYADMCETARKEAYDLIIAHAKEVGANAILGFRYDTSELGGGNGSSSTEVLCYGTAVNLVKE
jgi:uncharacterized protein YbjQ (UPF0145 family)